MTHPAFLPLLFLHFWFLDVPREATLYFLSLNKAFFHLLSVKMLLLTFFQPIKNEYREGLVRFSIVMGMVVKTCFLLVAMLLFIPLLAIELLILAFLIGFPFVVTALALFSIQ